MIKITFDAVNNPEQPTLILATRNGRKIGMINAKEIDMHDSMDDCSEMNFRVYKYVDEVRDPIWDKIQNFRLAWWKEQNTWYEMTVEVDEAVSTVKTVTLTQLGRAELSQIYLYDMEINSEDDVLFNDGLSVMWNPGAPEKSILHRILDKAPHWTVAHVDSSLANIGRQFSFDNKSIYDAFADIREEIGCVFAFSPLPDDPSTISRNIAIYDLYNVCRNCGYREEDMTVCPECGSTNILSGYGNDTAIFVTADELAQQIGLQFGTENIKNCYRLSTGDDLMTATVRNANINGSDYIWYFTDLMKEDMSAALVSKLEDYQTAIAALQLSSYPLDADAYNAVIQKISQYDNDFEEIVSPLQGYTELVKTYYDTIDLKLYLQSGMMPTPSMSETTAEDCMDLVREITSIAVSNLNAVSTATLNNTYSSYAKAMIPSGFTLQISDTYYNSDSKKYRATVTITNTSNADDVAEETISQILVTDDYETFVLQKINKVLENTSVDEMSVKSLFDLSLSNFKAEIKKYGLSSLSSFQNCAQGVIDILVQLGSANGQTWAEGNDIYDNIYVPFVEKYEELGKEMRRRERDIATVEDMQNAIQDQIDQVKRVSNLQEYLGPTLWAELSMFRREEEYSDSNYISDGLTNRELFENAQEFLNKANTEMAKAAESNINISTTLNNLLHLEKFEPIKDSFSVGNWIRVQVDDIVYKLRLKEYSINYDNFSTINVDFAKIVRTGHSTNIVNTLRMIMRNNEKTRTIIENITVDNSTLLEDLINAVNEALNQATTANDNASKLESRADSGEFNGKDGESSLYVLIETSAGNIFKNNGVNTILTAHAYYGSEEVTADITRWTWKKHNADGTEDESFHPIAGNIITLTPSDVQNRAVFYCYAEYM